MTELRVVPLNAIGRGQPSDSVFLTSAALPSASLNISVSEFGESYLVLEWTVPLNTGIGDQSLPIISYELQVDEGFGVGFVPITKNYTDT